MPLHRDRKDVNHGYPMGIEANVGLVIWPVKIVPEMTYNVLSGMLSLYTTTAA